MGQVTIARKGSPMSEKSFKEWQKAFSDIEESTNTLYKKDNRAYNKGTKPKRRNQV
jgi:hypothetical protein